jgi:hypothetical protein
MSCFKLLVWSKIVCRVREVSLGRSIFRDQRPRNSRQFQLLLPLRPMESSTFPFLRGEIFPGCGTDSVPDAEA